MEVQKNLITIFREISYYYKYLKQLFNTFKIENNILEVLLSNYENDNTNTIFIYQLAGKIKYFNINKKDNFIEIELYSYCKNIFNVIDIYNETNKYIKIIYNLNNVNINIEFIGYSFEQEGGFYNKWIISNIDNKILFHLINEDVFDYLLIDTKNKIYEFQDHEGIHKEDIELLKTMDYIKY